METTTSVDAIGFTRYEWGVVALLGEVRRSLVEPRVAEWQQRVGSDPVLAANLQSAFENLVLVYRSEPEGQDIAEQLEQSLSSSTMPAMLTRHGDLLFNSYFFDVTTTFGEPALVPVVLGASRVVARTPASVGSHISSPKARFLKAMGHLRKHRIPYWLAWSAVPDYGSQILPCTGGVTPRLYGLVSRPGVDEARKSQVEGRWLGRVALLDKQVDYRAGTVSALILPLVPDTLVTDQEYPTLVVTSIVPDAFESTDGSLRRTLLEFLGQTSLHDHPRYAGMYPNDYFWLSSDFGTLTGLVPAESIRKHLREFFASAGRDGILAYHVWCRPEPAISAATLEAVVVNASALYQMIPRLFPSGPWLFRSMVQRDGDAFDLDRLRECSRFWRVLLNMDNASEVIAPEPIRELFELIVPEMIGHSAGVDAKGLRRYVSCADLGERWVIVAIGTVHNAFEQDTALAELRDSLRQHAEPKGEKPLLADLLDELNHQWHDRDLGRHTSWEPSPSARPVLKKLADVFMKSERGPSQIRAVWLLERKKLAVPTAEGNGVEALCRTFSEFWLLEAVARRLLRSDVMPRMQKPISDTRGLLSKYRWRADPAVPAIRVALTGRDEEKVRETNLVALINYLGLPVVEWQTGQTRIEISVTSEGQSAAFAHSGERLETFLAKVDREWLRQALLVPAGLACLKMAEQSATEPRLERIEVNKDDPHEQMICWSNAASPLSVHWAEEDTFEVVFCALNRDGMLAAAQREPALWREAVSSESSSPATDGSKAPVSVKVRRSAATLGPVVSQMHHNGDVADAVVNQLSDAGRAFQRESSLWAYSVTHPVKNRLAAVSRAVAKYFPKEDKRVGADRVRRFADQTMRFADIIGVLHRALQYGPDDVFTSGRYGSSEPLGDVVATVARLADGLSVHGNTNELIVSDNGGPSWQVRPFKEIGAAGKRMRPGDAIYEAIIVEILHNALRWSGKKGELTRGNRAHLGFPLSEASDPHLIPCGVTIDANTEIGPMLIVSNWDASRRLSASDEWKAWSDGERRTGGGTGLMFVTQVLQLLTMGSLHYRTNQYGDARVLSVGLQLRGLEIEQPNPDLMARGVDGND